MTLDAWLSAADGDASGFWFQSLLAELAFPESFVWGEMAAMASQRRRGGAALLRVRRDRGTILGNPGTDFIWGGGAARRRLAGPATTTSTSTCGRRTSRRC